MTTRPFLTAQHAWSLCTCTSAGKASYRSVARSSRHTCFIATQPVVFSPLTTNPGRSVLI